MLRQKKAPGFAGALRSWFRFGFSISRPRARPRHRTGSFMPTRQINSCTFTSRLAQSVGLKQIPVSMVSKARNLSN